ncbi:LuxR family two component transcriptional regulator (plasmid) [Calothrix sp. NIES-4071]|nr:LuxR family two component transcriptional regulator [Calothrix sp. NIES-4071]BAZ64517.1 LuxR family two component transcriptional regulator [Calothrix sp. NIES-4105]
MVSVNSVESTVSQDLSVGETLKVLVVDDHRLILTGTLGILSQHYPNVEVLEAQTAFDVLQHLDKSEFDLIVTDLAIPEQPGDIAEIDTGIKLLQTLLESYKTQNFLVQTSHVKALVRIKHSIDNHDGGFAIADKTLPEQEMLNRLRIALTGGTHTKDIKTGIELKPEWFEVLRLAFEEGLTDKAIANKMYKCQRAVRIYWTKIQDVLEVYPEDCKHDGKSLRIQTEIRARQEGLID